MIVIKETKEDIWEMNGGDRELHEARILRKLKPANCPNIIRLINYKRFSDVTTHRLYLQYCPHGDLEKLAKRYRRWR